MLKIEVKEVVREVLLQEKQLQEVKEMDALKWLEQKIELVVLKEIEQKE